jgi:hypothetical protein
VLTTVPLLAGYPLYQRVKYFTHFRKNLDRDIKFENIVVASSGCVLDGEFGASCVVKQRSML